MKKLLLTVALALAGTATAAPVTLSFWNYWDGTNGQVLDSLIQQFNKAHPDIQVKADFTPGSDLLNKLQTAIVGKSTPDLAIADLVWMPSLVRSGALVDLTPYLKSNNISLSDFYAQPLVYGQYNGGQYSLPVSASNLALFWNKDLFRKAGLNPARPPRTWDELVSFSQQIKERTGKLGFELYTAGGEGTSWQWQVFNWQAGGNLLSKDLKTAVVNSPASVAALQFWVDLIQKYKVAAIAEPGAFKRGEAAMVMDGSWMTQFFPNDVDFELGAAAMPVPKGGKQATNMGGEQLYIFKSNPDKEKAAFEFVKWFTSTPVQVQWIKGTGFIPTKASVATNASLVNYIKNTKPLLLPFVQVQKYAQARPPVVDYARISDTLARDIQEALYGRMTAKAALDKAVADINATLKK
ncbi:MAG TPA: ABC transporter substrate-binding protein [Deinococcales bacterium]|nr:ABC transporter substrate-binding protein [Deinococcales bacterium]